MKTAGITIILSSILTCACAVFMAARGAASFPVILALFLSGCSGLAASFLLESRRRELSRVLAAAGRIDLSLASGIVSAVPDETGKAVMRALADLETLRLPDSGPSGSGGQGSQAETADRILEAMQFQDSERQALEGALWIIDAVRENLDAACRKDLPRVDEKWLQDTFANLREELLPRAKTKIEKQAVMEARI